MLSVWHSLHLSGFVKKNCIKNFLVTFESRGGAGNRIPKCHVHESETGKPELKVKLCLEDPFTMVTTQVKYHCTEQHYYKMEWHINSPFSALFLHFSYPQCFHIVLV